MKKGKRSRYLTITAFLNIKSQIISRGSMKTLLRLFEYAKEFKWYFISSIFSMILLTGINLAIPRFITPLFSMMSGEDEVFTFTSVLYLAVALFILYASRVLFSFLSSYIPHVGSWKFVAKMRSKVYDHIQNLSMDYFSDKQTGQLMSRVINDTNMFEQLVAHAIPNVITNVLTLVGVTIILLTISAKLALLTLIPVPFILVLVFWFSKKVRPIFKNAQEKIADLSADLQDNFSGIREIKVFNQEEYESRNIFAKAWEHSKSILMALKYSAVFHPSITFSTSLGTVIVVLFGGMFALKGTVNTADIAAFLLYLAMFYQPITALAQMMEDVQRAMAGAERVFEVLDEESTVSDAPNAIDIDKAEGEIKFENVSFKYEDDIPVLKDINFTVKPGTTLALVGPTGVGKSTISKLISRFYDPTEGRIMVDGIGMKDIAVKSLRKNISIVLQDVFLFNGTIADNISYSRQEASRQEIIEASKAAYIHGFIETLPQGYDTMVGERGLRLSGGQKQRVAIARAILKNASVLILDEATSAVDTETETEIQNAINGLSGKCTMVIIAHRLSTVRKADNIIVLTDNKITEQGTHEELMSKKGIYSRLYTLQYEAQINRLM